MWCLTQCYRSPVLSSLHTNYTTKRRWLFGCVFNGDINGTIGYCCCCRHFTRRCKKFECISWGIKQRPLPQGSVRNEKTMEIKENKHRDCRRPQLLFRYVKKIAMYFYCSSLLGRVSHLPSTFGVHKGDSDLGAIIVTIPRELQGNSELVVFLGPHPVKSKKDHYHANCHLYYCLLY